MPRDNNTHKPTAEVEDLDIHRATRLRKGIAEPAEAMAEYERQLAEWVEKINQDWCWIESVCEIAHIITDNTEVDEEFRERTQVNMIKRDKFQLNFANKRLKKPVIKVNGGVEYIADWKDVNPATEWIHHDNRREYECITNYPHRYDEQPPAKRLNMWTGWGAVPVKDHYTTIGEMAAEGLDINWPCPVLAMGDNEFRAAWPEACKMVLQHIYEAVCAGNRDIFAWLLAWIAHILQRPRDLPDSFVWLISEEGAGKGSFMQVLARLLGDAFLEVCVKDQAFGRFNGHQQGLLVMVLNEIFVRDHETANQLKGMTTAKHVNMEQKNKDILRLRNTTRVFGTSNDEYSWKASLRDRRACMLRMADHRMARVGDEKARAENAEYFNALYAEIASDEAMQSLAHFLFNLDISGVRLNQPPETAALAAQKIAALSPLGRWWYECLCEGVISGDDYTQDSMTPWPEKRTLTQLYASFDTWAKREKPGQYERPGRPAIMSFLKKKDGPVRLLGIAGRQSTGKREYEYSIPSIDEAKENFAQWLGCSVGEIDWGDGRDMSDIVKENLAAERRRYENADLTNEGCYDDPAEEEAVGGFLDQAGL